MIWLRGDDMDDTEAVRFIMKRIVEEKRRKGRPE